MSYRERRARRTHRPKGAIHERYRRAAELRKRGWSMRQIGDALGVAEETARKWIEAVRDEEGT